MVETRRKSSKAMILLGVLKFKQSNLKLKIVLFLKYAHSFCVMKVHVKCFIFGYCFACLLEINHFHKNAIKIHKKFLEVLNTRYSSLNSWSSILYSFEYWGSSFELRLLAFSCTILSKLQIASWVISLSHGLFFSCGTQEKEDVHKHFRTFIK